MIVRELNLARLSFVGGWGNPGVRVGFAACQRQPAGEHESRRVSGIGRVALICALPAVVVSSFEVSGSSSTPGERWSQLHGLLMLASTAGALSAGLPPLPTSLGLLSLSVLIVRSRGAWTPSGRFGLANAVTTVRLLMTLALVWRPEQRQGLALALAALTILVLDLVDGWLARRFQGGGPFGARFDMEVDAVFVLALSCALWSRGVGGAWVLLAGLWRYLFVVIPMAVPSRGGEAPRSLIYRSAYAVMVSSFLIALLVQASISRPLALFGTVVISASFLRSFWYRYSPPSTA